MNTRTKVTNVVVDSQTHAFIEREQKDALDGARAAGLVHVAKDLSCPACGGELVVSEYRSDGWRVVRCPIDTEYELQVRSSEVVPG